MTNKQITTFIGVLMIVGHFYVIGLLFYYRWHNNIFDDNTLKIALPVIIPLFASYSILIVRNAIENQNRIKAKAIKKSFLFSFIAIFLPVVFLSFIIMIVVSHSVNPYSLENFAAYLGTAESIFGIFLALIIKDIFKIKETEPHNEVSEQHD